MRHALVILFALVSVELIEVHGPNGQVYWVNTAEISSLRSPNPSDLQQHFAPNVHCIVTTTNGKFLAAIESCASIRDRLSRHPVP